MLAWPLLQGRRIDGAPALRIPSCAGERPSPLTSADTRLTEPRETRGPPSIGHEHSEATWRQTPRMTRHGQPLHTSQHKHGEGEQGVKGRTGGGESLAQAGTAAVVSRPHRP